MRIDALKRVLRLDDTNLATNNSDIVRAREELYELLGRAYVNDMEIIDEEEKLLKINEAFEQIYADDRLMGGGE